MEKRESARITCPKSSLPTWDGKWHLLFYDIPVKYNAARMALRDMIDDLGMYPLQKSLWVYPYNCEAEALFIARFFGVGVIDAEDDQPRIQVVRHVLPGLRQGMNAAEVALALQVSAKASVQLVHHLVRITL